jgi:hypothetical protein
MILQHASRVIWMDHKSCGFDWADVEKYRPDEVWWMPDERFLVCKPDLKPKGLPEGREESTEGTSPAGFAAEIGAAGRRNGARE